MRYLSTNKQAPFADFKTATIRGQAPDKGLYFPEHIPVFKKDFLQNINNWSREAVAFSIISPYVGDSIERNELKELIADAINFDFPLVQVDENAYSLELFHGPTLAFKDVGARFMSRCMGYFMKNQDKDVTVLVATSGDTGGAVASGFHNVPGVRVVILYPSKKVSSIQELQLTTFGDNVEAIEVNGTFDDCQRLVKQAFADNELQEKLFLTSANSINVARWLPQQFYYAFAWSQWKEKDPPVFSIPSGNFGNLCAGLLTHVSGLSAAHFIAACNANDTVPHYLESGLYEAKPAIPTISNAMDVGNPSNWIRVMELFDHDAARISQLVSGYSITDDETKQTIQLVHLKHKYLLDPHGAVGYLALKRFLNNHREKKGIFLATAHPIKFFDVIEPVTGQKIPLPQGMEEIISKKKKSIAMNVDYENLRSLLLK